VRDKEGKICGYAKVIRDLTERKRAEEQRDQLLQELQQANQAKDRFLATMSHELRTPLAAILGWLSLMREKRLQPEQIEPAIESSYRNARIQKSLIDDLLDISRITVGQLALETRPVDLREIVRPALDSVRLMAAQKHIEVDSVVEETIPAVIGDARRLQQITWNLLANAIKFTPKEGRIELHVHHRDRNVEIRVSDNGQGMSPAFIPYAFDTFRQEQDSTTRPYGGMGLGLAIVKQLTELHGGKVSAFSEGVGKGSTFTVVLPATESAAAEDAGKAEEPSLHALANKRVLILENDPDCREFLLSAVQSHGGAAECAATAREAFEKMLGFKPDIMLVDIVLPEEDGYQFLKRLRAFHDPAIRSIPAIALTALATDDFRKRALAEGFQSFIAKPVPADEIICNIAALLRPSDSREDRRIA
jgi:CheY-like chemotaxis protein/nitrogen-specific signal transduction histidine kinase